MVLIRRSRRRRTPEPAASSDLLDIDAGRASKQATVRRLANDQFETTLTVDAGKFYSDGKGNERPAAFDEWVDVGVFTARPGEGSFGAADVLSMQRFRIHSGEQTVQIVTRQKPVFAGIDPYINFIDRNSNDNIVEVAQSSP
jgi:ABC-2 type transport system permease protein